MRGGGGGGGGVWGGPGGFVGGGGGGGGGGLAFGVLLGILGGGRGMLPGSPNPDPI